MATGDDPLPPSVKMSFIILQCKASEPQWCKELYQDPKLRSWAKELNVSGLGAVQKN